ncbi:MAG: hypothetical protein AAF745_02490 [Planctomycetota bacterium]
MIASRWSWLGCHDVDVLVTLARMRVQSRVNRWTQSLRSPRGILAATGIITFIALYLWLGMIVADRREPTHPQSLRLWLSGGMVLYLIFHAVKQLWSIDYAEPHVLPEQPRGHRDRNHAEALWLVGGPIQRRWLVWRELLSTFPPAFLKGSPLLIILHGDVDSRWRMAAGVTLAMVTLEGMRRITSTAISALSHRQRAALKLVTIIVVASLAAQLIGFVVSHVQPDADPVAYTLHALVGIGHLASTPAIQVMALPLWPAATFATTSSQTFGGVMGSAPLACWGMVAILLPLLIGRWLVDIDHWSRQRRQQHEVEACQAIGQASKTRHMNQGQHPCLRGDWISRCLQRITIGPLRDAAWLGVLSRQLHCLIRYRSHVLMSLGIPTALSLSPLWTDQTAKQWLFVISGVLLSSVLLAPPALQIDFRRDYRRMGLLKSLPITSGGMCLGMLSVPVIMTVLFQWFTLTTASWAVPTAWSRYAALMLGLPAIAVVTFAIENALFLLFPHAVGAQGIRMLLRTKATFLWKAMLIAMVPASIALIIVSAQTWLPASWVVNATCITAIGIWWTLAAISVAFLSWTWRRFDPSRDVLAL